ncbi:MAG TPA: hypothetical protein VIQ05_26535 [Tardiphaga sp.]
MVLWLVTPRALGGDGIALWINGRRRSKTAQSRTATLLTADEETRLQELMTGERSPRKSA